MSHRPGRAGGPDRHLQALVAVIAASQSLDLEAVLRRSLDALLAATGLDAAEIFLREPGGDLVLAVHRGRFPESFREITRFSPGEGFPGRVAESGQPLVTTDLAADLRFLRRSVVQAGFRSFACIPLLAGARVVGTLDVASLDVYRFTGEELAFLGAVGRHLGVAVENARLHEEVRRRAETLESEVEARTADLRRQEGRVQAILDAVGEGIVVTDRQGTILYVNPAVQRLTGYTAPECVGQTPRLWKSGQTPPEVYREMWAAILAGQSWQGELTNRRKDGSLYPVLLTITPLPGPDGRAEGFVGIQQDLTVHKERERDLQERNAALEHLTRELESFTYSVSHDLKAPLRGIDGFARALVEDYGDQLDPTARHYLDMICTGVAHMGQLIDGLLAYSRLERRELAGGPVELVALIEELLADRRFEIEERRISTRVALPFRQVRGEPEGLRQLFGNLIDNAIKFTRDRPDPEIVIGGEESDSEQVVWVKDNGIGFDMRYHDRIFQIFQRLHRAEDYPGTGIGLAIARKVVEKLGGRLWAESEPGKGATFYVSLPRERA